MIETWKAWVMLAFGVLIGAVLVYVLPWPLVFGPSKKDWVEAASAIGTVAAVLVALGVATKESLRRRGEERQRAALVAAQIVPQLQRSLNEIDALSAEFEYVDLESGEMMAHSRYISRLQRLKAPSVSAADLRALVSLPNNVAFRLARADALILREVQYLYEGNLSRRVRDMHGVSEEEEKEFSRRLSGPTDMLRVVIQDLEYVASPLVVFPDDTGIYGEWD